MIKTTNSHFLGGKSVQCVFWLFSLVPPANTEEVWLMTNTGAVMSSMTQSAKEAFVCVFLIVCLYGGLHKIYWTNVINLGCVISQRRTHNILMWIQELYFTFFHYSLHLNEINQACLGLIFISVCVFLCNLSSRIYYSPGEWEEIHTKLI